MKLDTIAALVSAASYVSAQQIAQDPGVRGPPLEIVHLYYNEFPTAVAVSSSNRIFSCYPAGLDANNTQYQVAELTGNSTETPYPNARINSPPGGSLNYNTYPVSSANYQNYFIGVQSILDTGRALTPNGTLAPAVYGGPKLVAVDLATNTINRTILLPPTVAYPLSYINDVRIDLRPNVSASGQGVAYITDSSQMGTNGLIIVDLGANEAWRHLDNSPTVRATRQHFKEVWGESVYFLPGPGLPYTYDPTGADGIAFLDGGDTIVWSPTGSRYLYSIANKYLLDNSLNSEITAQTNIRYLGEKGTSDGLMQDTNQYVYAGNFEQNAINIYNNRNNTVSTYVRDPRIGWTDSMWISNGYLYFVENQLWRSPSYFPGTDRRIKPYVLYRVPTADGGQRVAPLNITS
ncbi:hypothetical protein PV11_09280 [Exophiala sideris]|uniref:Major royal jelly protein n=1 Tax=Exophiala sideris TaxID=1016849 RepID=A0A0D1VNB4_9EURO|nr:hypothetical protein PV11_09280 [Exophiala sideris]